MAAPALRDENEGLELRKGDKTVGLTDHKYPIAGQTVHFDEILVTGDLSGELNYNGWVLRVVDIDTFVGLEVDRRGPRGPLWKGVTLEVVH